MGMKKPSRLERVGMQVWKMRAEAAREFRRAKRANAQHQMTYEEGRFDALSKVMNAIYDTGAMIEHPRRRAGKGF